MIRPLLSLTAAAAFLLAGAAPASAGTYTVNACAVGEQQFGNQLLRALKASPPVAFDTTCSRADTGLAIAQNSGTTAADGTEAILGFDAPAGSTIAGFSATRRLVVRNSNTPGHNPYVIGVLGSTVFEGAGNYDGPRKAALGRQGSWAGGSSNQGDTGFATATVANRPALAGYAGDATQLSFRVGCFRRGTTCDLDASGVAAAQLRGLSVTVEDPTPPALVVAATGLLAGGSPSGATPVTLDASDGAGVQSVALIDVTDPAAPQVVGGETYDPGVAGAAQTDDGQSCTYKAARACPNLGAETVVPTALASGVRQLVVRATDAAGNSTDAGPYRVDVSTPSNRGALNGANATEEATISAGFTTTRKGSRTVDNGARPTIRGTLTNSGGTPISGARVVVYTRDTDAARYVRRGTVTTGASGRYELRAKTPNSRYVRVVWVSHEFDTRTAATDAVKIRVRARAKLSAPRTISVGRRFSIRGQLQGADPPRGVRIAAQAFEKGRYRTYKLASADDKGRFVLTDRLFNASSRGRTFRLRVRIIPKAGWPYTGGATRTLKVRVR